MPAEHIVVGVTVVPARLLEKLGERLLQARVFQESKEHSIDPADAREDAEQLRDYCLKGDCIPVPVAAVVDKHLDSDDVQTVLDALVWRIAIQEAVVKPREKR